MSEIQKLRCFIQQMTELVARAGDDEPTIVAAGGRLLADLVAEDDWLPEAFAQPHPEYYRQYRQLSP